MQFPFFMVYDIDGGFFYRKRRKKIGFCRNVFYNLFEVIKMQNFRFLLFIIIVAFIPFGFSMFKEKKEAININKIPKYISINPSQKR